MSSDDSDGRIDDEEPQERRWLRDPYLLLLSSFGRILDFLGATYEWFEELPGKVRFLSGLVFFLFSIYFGDSVKAFLNSLAARTITPVLGDLIQFPFSVQVILFLLVILSIQASLVNYRSSRINYRLNRLERKIDQSMEAAEGTATDGGQRQSSQSPVEDVESSGAGALGGAAAGAAIGATFGPGGVVGGAVLGAILGDEVEKSSTRSKKKKQQKAEVVERLLLQRASKSRPVPAETILEWFPGEDSKQRAAIIEDLVTDSEIPVGATSDGEVYLTNLEEAAAYLERLDGGSEIRRE